MGITQFRGRRENPQTVYLLIFHANEKEFVESLTEEQTQLLEKYVLDIKPEQCTCCPCFAWKFDENKRICGCLCTLGGDPKEDGIGECYIWQMANGEQIGMDI